MDDFIPDYSYKATAGLISNHNSIIKQVDDFNYISVFNKVNVWNAKTEEIINSLGTSKRLITAFDVSKKKAVIGYENGVVEIIKLEDNSSRKIKVHSKRVSCIRIYEDFFISSSSDGSLISYDMIIEDFKISYKGNDAAIEHFDINNEIIAASCSDKTIKIWKPNIIDLLDAIAFDFHIFKIIIHGNEIMVFLKNGDSYFLNGREKVKFDSFKKIKDVVKKNNLLSIQSIKKNSTYEITKESSFGLKLKRKIETNDLITSFDFYNNESLIFVMKNNRFLLEKITNKFSETCFHEEEILQVEVDEDRIYSLSKDKFIYWNKNEDSLDFMAQTKLNKGNSFCLFNDSIVISTSSKLEIYSKDLCEKINDIGKKADSICTYNNVMAICKDTSVEFYDEKIESFCSLDLVEPAVFSRFSDDGSLFYVSTLDNKINIFNYPSLDLKITLYGHSLPVRAFSISKNNKTLISCSADKIIKIWGSDFGECRKTIIGNAKNVEMLKSELNLFMFADKTLNYYNNFNKLKSFKLFNCGIIKFGDDFMVCTSDKGISLFYMNTYEYIEESSSEEVHESNKAVVDVKGYDRFLEILESFEKDSSKNDDILYRFIESTDLNELTQFLYVLDHVSVHILMNTIENHLDQNLIVNSRLFLQLLKCHKDSCLSHKSFEKIRSFLYEKVSLLRETIGCNEARVLVNINDENIGLEDY